MKGRALVASSVRLAAAGWLIAIATATPAEAQFVPPPWYAGFGAGWTLPTGEVDGITDLLEFPEPVAARDLYENGWCLEFFGGARTETWLFELDINMRIPELTAAGQQLVNLTSTLNQDVNVEYATFDLVGAKRFVLGTPVGAHTEWFVGLSVGAAIVQLNQGTGVEPHNDEGVGIGVKTGLDIFLGWRISARIAGRYHLVSWGSDVPNDVIVQLAPCINW